MITMQQAAQSAIDVQDACNLAGVLRSFVQVTEILWAEARRMDYGTAWVNTHPISILYASKIESLAGDDFSKAYDACKRLASTQTV